MPHTSIEYTILAPILLVQVILMPMAASWMMDSWVVRRRETALRDVANHMGTTIQQLYFTLSRQEIKPGTVIQTSNVPAYIESIPYTVTATEKRIENSTMLDLRVTLASINIFAMSRVTVGPNVLWKPSTFMSDAVDAHVKVEKFVNGTLKFSFG